MFRSFSVEIHYTVIFSVPSFTFFFLEIRPIFSIAFLFRYVLTEVPMLSANHTFCAIEISQAAILLNPINMCVCEGCVGVCRIYPVCAMCLNPFNLRHEGRIIELLIFRSKNIFAAVQAYIDCGTKFRLNFGEFGCWYFNHTCVPFCCIYMDMDHLWLLRVTTGCRRINWVVQNKYLSKTTITLSVK